MMIRLICSMLILISSVLILGRNAHAAVEPYPNWHFESHPRDTYDFELSSDQLTGSLKSKSDDTNHKSTAQIARIFDIQKLKNEEVELSIYLHFLKNPQNIKVFFSSYSIDKNNNIYKDILNEKHMHLNGWHEFRVRLKIPKDSHSVALNFLISGSTEFQFKNISLNIIQMVDKSVTKEAKKYFENAIQIIQTHHVDSNQVDWDRVMTDVEPLMQGAKEPSDTYMAIRHVLSSVGNRHSFLVNPSEHTNHILGEATSELPTWHLENRRFGRIRLPGLRTGDDKRFRTNAKRYVNAITSGLKVIDKANLCGWIIDLRDNDGGNMWPMLLGIAPLLGNDPYGYFVNKEGKVSPWSHTVILETKRRIYSDDSSIYVSLRNRYRPIAVLIGHNTGSSGEMVALSFKSKNNSRFFGLPTNGLTSGNETFSLPDGAKLVLTTTYIKDAKGRLYRNEPITPDEPANDNDIEKQAIRWLRSVC